MYANAILQDIQHLLDNPTAPANVPLNALAYPLTNKVLDSKSRDRLNKMDEAKLMAETERRDKIIEFRLSNVGAGYGAKKAKSTLSTKQFFTATIPFQPSSSTPECHHCM